MHRLIRPLIRPAHLAVALAVAGCGGGKGPSKADYVQRADRICTQARVAQQKLGSPRASADIGDLAVRTKPILQAELRRLRALETPDEVAAAATETYDLLDRQVAQIDRLAVAAKQRDLARIQSVATAAARLNDQATAKAKPIGFKVCGKG